MVDIARLSAMLFIVVGHTNIRPPFYPGYSPLLSFIVVFSGPSAIPFYFFMAGYFARPEQGRFNWRRAGMILLALIFWCIIGHFWFGALAQLEAGKEVNFLALCNSSIWGSLGAWNSVGTPGSCDCWFLKVLIPLVFVSGVLLRLSSPLLLTLICGVGIWVTATYSSACVPFFLTSEALSGFVYFAFGILVRRYVTLQHIQEWTEKFYKYVIAVTIIYGVAMCFLPLYRPWNFLTGIWGILFILSFAKAVEVLLPRFAVWFASFGAGVFFIYMMQEMLIIQCRWFFTLYPINKHLYALVPFGIFAVLMLGYAILRRFMPWAGCILWLASVRKKS